MSDPVKRLCRPGYDLQKEQAIQEAIIEIRELRAKIEAIPYGAIANTLTEVMDIAAANGADSRSMPDEYVEVAAWLCGIPGAQPAPSDEYVGWYCAHCQRGVDASEVTYHEQHQVCGRVITEDKPPKPAPNMPEGTSPIDMSQLEGVVSTEIVHSYPPPSGWLRAIDEALIVAHIGMANADAED